MDTFERYCDDIVVHCVSEKQTRYLEKRIAARLGEVGLRLHPDKTKVVFCPQDGRDDPFGTTSFTFLGYTFRKRTARGRGGVRNGFLPAVSNDAMKKMSRAVAPGTAGGCTGGPRCHWTNSRHGSTRSCAGGSTSTVGSTGPRCCPSSAGSTPTSLR